MDTAELARQFAAKYHDDAVARGLNPWEPYQFAVAEANRRDIDVEGAAPGATILANSRATFIQGDQLIVHEKTGSQFEQAFLVAHEIGHSELGDDVEAGDSVQIDPARSSEPSPVGLDRVVDYGRRQRREVQMDLFAREFLLPRHFVRKLHLELNLSATEIAERLKAPFDVVAQQLFDALLLPVVVMDTKQEAPERPPNDLQIAAAAHRGVAFLLEAGPGTGKTQTLTLRVEGLLDQGVDPRRILLLTFSNKAAGEMAERIARKHKDATAAMWIGTFHAFGLDIIRRFHKELGLSQDPRMLDRTEAAEILENEFPRLGLIHYRDLYDPTQIIADILSAISRAKDEVIDEAKYAELAEAMVRKAKTDEERAMGERALEVAKVYAAYEKLKKEANSVDFGDLVSMPVRLFETNATIREHIQTQYDHVLVDEYQDVNRSSVRLLTALRGSGDNLWTVGDAKQSIYRFRGASSFNMGRFGKEDFAGGKRGRLKKNYRSVSEVVDFFSAFAVEMKVGDADSALESHRGPCGKKPELLTVVQADEQPVALADNIQSLRQAGHCYRDQAVLCTGNEKLSQLGQDLERLGLPVLFLGSLFERTEVKDLFALLSILTDRRATGLVRIACWPEFKTPIVEVAKVIDQLRANEAEAGQWLRQLEKVPNLSDQARAALTTLAGALEGFNETSSPWDVLAKVLLDRTRIAARIAKSEMITDRTRGIAIWQLMNFLRVQPAAPGLPIVRVMDRVRRLLRLGDDRDLRQLPACAQGIDAVRLMTIHGAKGLEFPVVHLPGMNAGTIPRTGSPPACPPPDGMVEGAGPDALASFQAGQAEEQECLFYVAMSRARDRLFFYAPTKKANGHNWGISPFLARLGQTLDQQKISPSRKLPGTPEDTNIEVAFDGGLGFKGEQLSLFEGCPRRFFYTHILQIGGRRRATAFMQMHEAVRTVFKGVIDGSAPIENPEELTRRVSDAFVTHGLADHGYANEYKAFALPMLRYFASVRENHTPQPIAALSLKFENEQIIVLPDDVLLKPDGKRTFRRVKTGHERADDAESVDAAALILAAQQAFPDAIVELIYLSDAKIAPLSMTAKKLENRKQKLNQFLKEIRLGQFPAKLSARTCPNCPAFFICGPTPHGILQRKV
ncbi:MAG: UvrD-helicase domain-containing protein [Verrucomicrobiota bacterium]|jgi:superfamily I DNA/RNA helicase